MAMLNKGWVGWMGRATFAAPATPASLHMRDLPSMSSCPPARPPCSQAEHLLLLHHLLGERGTLVNCALPPRMGQPGLSCTGKPEVLPQPLVLHLQQAACCSPAAASCCILPLQLGYLVRNGRGREEPWQRHVLQWLAWLRLDYPALQLRSCLHALLPDTAKPASPSTATAPQPMQIVSSVTAIASCYMWMPKRPHEMGILQVRGRAGSFCVERPAILIPSGTAILPLNGGRLPVAVHMHELRLNRHISPHCLPGLAGGVCLDRGRHPAQAVGARLLTAA